MSVDAKKLGAGLVTVAAAAALVVGNMLEGGTPAPACHWVTGVALKGDAGQYMLAHARRGVLDDGGVAFPATVLPLETREDTGCYDAGSDLRVWAAGDATTPWPCACSSGHDCQVPGLPFDVVTMRPTDVKMVAAPLGQTLQPGWVGSGCRAKACVELAGVSSWDSRCPTK